MTEPSERDMERARALVSRLKRRGRNYVANGYFEKDIAAALADVRREALEEAAGVAECGVKCCERPNVRNIIKLDVLGEPVVTGQEQRCCGCPEPLEPHEIAAAIRALTGGGNG